MNKALTSLTTVIFSTALLTLAGSALAQEPPGPGHFRDGPHHGPGMFGMPGVDMVMRGVMHLDLSDDQRDSIKDIMKTLKTEDRQLMKETKSGHEQLKDLIKADTFDETAVADIAEKEGAVTTQRVILGSRALSQVYALLTDEQRTELETMAAERAERRAERRAEMLERLSEDDDV